MGVAAWLVSISIHALREEGDCVILKLKHDDDEFLSTPSARRATAAVENTAQVVDISIHALREEGDDQIQHAAALGGKFLSTPSARRATFIHDYQFERV